jgi:hypothetical protein
MVCDGMAMAVVGGLEDFSKKMVGQPSRQFSGSKKSSGIRSLILQDEKMGWESVTTFSKDEKIPPEFSQPIFRVKKLPRRKFDEFFDPWSSLGELPRGLLILKLAWKELPTTP